MVDDARQVADAVAVAVGEAARVDLVDDAASRHQSAPGPPIRSGPSRRAAGLDHASVELLRRMAGDGSRSIAVADGLDARLGKE